MKRLLISFYVVISVGLIIGAFYIASQKPKFTVNRCQIAMALLKGGYRVWGVTYCDGFQPQPDGTEKHFYRAPKFRHMDIRRIK